jgi:hypothetical protein
MSKKSKFRLGDVVKDDGTNRVWVYLGGLRSIAGGKVPLPYSHPALILNYMEVEHAGTDVLCSDLNNQEGRHVLFNLLDEVRELEGTVG